MDAENAVGEGLGALEWKKLALDMKLRYSLCLYFPLFFCKYTAQNVLNFFPLLKIRTVSFVLVIFFSWGLKGHMPALFITIWVSVGLKIAERGPCVM